MMAAAERAASNWIATDIGGGRSTVILWRKRFEAGGPAALTERSSTSARINSSS
jgi:transposase